MKTCLLILALLSSFSCTTQPDTISLNFTLKEAIKVNRNSDSHAYDILLPNDAYLMLVGYRSKDHYNLRIKQETWSKEQQANHDTIATEDWKRYSIQSFSLSNGLIGKSFIWVDDNNEKISQIKIIGYSNADKYGMECQAYDIPKDYLVTIMSEIEAITIEE